jgi:single-stranded DNA-specific DHH superfamily exonuclease
MSLDDVRIEFGKPGKEPDWRTPNEFYETEARAFSRPGTPDGVVIDEAVALRLLKLEFGGKDFRQHQLWYNPVRKLVVPPEKTVPGMTSAAKTIKEALQGGELIAVFCDYDVDGTSAGEAFRRGLAPYDAKLMYGYADAQQGFGLTDSFVREAASAGAKVIITLDCGSTQTSQVKLAQSLGMKVVVVDHHNVDPQNPAEHHLNPKLSEPMSSDNTGAQLAWKLAAATQIAMEGKTREEHWQEAMYLAGMGALADMGSVLQHENRAFFWVPAEHPVPGVRALAKRLGEDPLIPGMVLTQAAMNLPKRTTHVSAADIGLIMAAESEEEAEPLIEKLANAYEQAKPVRKDMQAAALEQTGVSERDDDGIVTRPEQQLPGRDPEDPQFFAVAVLDNFKDYAGYTGPVANQVSRSASRPAVVFALKGKDEFGQTLYKFSARNDCGANGQLGDLIEDPAMKAACSIKKRNESDEIIESPSLGGHREVVSGSCTKENLPNVVAAMETWAAAREKASRSGFWPGSWDGPEAFLSARKVDPARLSEIEQEAVKLGPFTSKRQPLFTTASGKENEASNRELQISVDGVLGNLSPDPENEKWLQGTLTLTDGSEREIRFPLDIEEIPEGRPCEWVLRIGRPGPYYLRMFHDPAL